MSNKVYNLIEALCSKLQSTKTYKLNLGMMVLENSNYKNPAMLQRKLNQLWI
jgi:hypothetical protein